MLRGHRLTAALLFVVPLIAGACGEDDGSAPNGPGAQAGEGGSGAQAGKRGAGAHAGEGGNAGSSGEPDCVRASDNSDAVVAPLADHCAQFGCPATVAEAAARALTFCGNIFPPRISIGCGTITVDDSDFSGGSSYTFDATTMLLLGVTSSSDIPYGECHVHEYRYGEFGPDCPEAATCHPCEDAEAAAGAGAAGAAGTTGAARCPSF